MSSSSKAESQMQRELHVSGGREASGNTNNNMATVVFARPPKQASEQDSDTSTDSKVLICFLTSSFTVCLVAGFIQCIDVLFCIFQMTGEVAWLASLALELDDYRYTF